MWSEGSFRYTLWPRSQINLRVSACNICRAVMSIAAVLSPSFSRCPSGGSTVPIDVSAGIMVFSTWFPTSAVQHFRRFSGNTPHQQVALSDGLQQYRDVPPLICVSFAFVACVSEIHHTEFTFGSSMAFILGLMGKIHISSSVVLDHLASSRALFTATLKIVY